MTITQKKKSISYKGKIRNIPAIEIDNFTIIVSGKYLKQASIVDEVWELKEVTDPDKIVGQLKCVKPRIDIFTFSQRLPYVKPQFNLNYEWKNVAAIPISTYENWFKNQINSKTRNMIRKAEKSGVSVKNVEFDNELVKGITQIYNETPIRQGRKFWHYGKDFNAVKRENGTYLERATFIAAFFTSEIIGFIKMVNVGTTAIAMQILAKNCHRDKAPMNAMLAKAVEICVERGSKYLIYGNFIYGKKGIDSLSEFKKHNGFLQYDLPQYFISLTKKGKIALKLKLHHGFLDMMPSWLLKIMKLIKTH